MKTKKQTKQKQAKPQKRKAQTAITPIEYGGLQQAYDYFNKGAVRRRASGFVYHVSEKGELEGLFLG